MLEQAYPILEFDPTTTAIIEPRGPRAGPRLPRHAVLCFFQDVIDALVALVVEMEAAAFFAVAHFRGVRFGQVLYGGDNVGGAEWDARDWNTHSVRETLFWLAAEACLSL